MKSPPLTPRETRQLQKRYRLLAARLARFDSLSRGSVLPKPPNAWRWTRKVAGKTISLGLSAAKAQKMKHAIANHRTLDQIIDELRAITQTLILNTLKPKKIHPSKNVPNPP